MPNGGVPRWQFISPEGSAVVLAVKGTEMFVYDAQEFASQGANAPALLEMSQEHVFELRRHLNYWFDYKAGYIRTHEPRPEGINYDY